jgi:hypothetical protein
VLTGWPGNRTVAKRLMWKFSRSIATEVLSSIDPFLARLGPLWMCEARFALLSIARPRAISPPYRLGRDVFSRCASVLTLQVKNKAAKFRAAGV